MKILKREKRMKDEHLLSLDERLLFICECEEKWRMI